LLQSLIAYEATVFNIVSQLFNHAKLCSGASTGRVVDAGGTLVKIYAAPTEELQNALPLLLLLQNFILKSSGYATWFTAGGSIRIAHYDVIDDVITRKL